MEKGNYYKRVELLTLDIFSIKKDLRVKKKKRDILIRKCAPSDVRAIQHNKEASSHIVISDYEQIENLIHLQDEIDELALLLAEEEGVLKELRTAGEQTAERLKDTALKVFIAKYIDHKTNEQIATMLDRGIDRIWQINTEINKYLREGLEV